jgi:hypothetical protein
MSVSASPLSCPLFHPRNCSAEIYDWRPLASSPNLIYQGIQPHGPDPPPPSLVLDVKNRGAAAYMVWGQCKRLWFLVRAVHGDWMEIVAILN